MYPDTLELSLNYLHRNRVNNWCKPHWRLPLALRWIPKRKSGNRKKTALTATCFGSGMSRWTEAFCLFQDDTLHSGVLKTAAVVSTWFFGVLSSLVSSPRMGTFQELEINFKNVHCTKGFLYAAYTCSRILFSHML